MVLTAKNHANFERVSKDHFRCRNCPCERNLATFLKCFDIVKGSLFSKIGQMTTTNLHYITTKYMLCVSLFCGGEREGNEGKWA